MTIICFLFIGICITCSGQKDIVFQGTVVDSISKKPVENALIYLTQDKESQSRIIAYCNSDSAGNFSLKISDFKGSADLTVDHLSYNRKQYKITPNSIKSLRVHLTAKDFSLKEVVISDKMPPIIEQSDTMIYDIHQFIDSTEYSVEDLLKKLPGIEVLPNGSIKVQGKSIQTVLIEDSDLFGRKYTMGTKNIRAEAIDKVEVIDHYQDNPILKDVNMSEAIVLNLLLKESKKNVLAGGVNLGAGVDRNGKLMSASHLSTFLISKEQKYILLADNGNSITQYSIGELNAIYGSANKESVDYESFQPPKYLSFEDTRNPGIAKVFVDNSLRNFGTLRSETSLGDYWTIRANAVYSRKSDEQVSMHSQSYLFDDANYRLRTKRNLDLTHELYGGNLHINFMSTGKQHGLRTYIQWESRNRSNQIQLSEFKEAGLKTYVNNTSEAPKDWFAAGLYSHKFSDKTVGQLLMRSMSYQNRLVLNAENEDIPSYFGLNNEFIALDQLLKYSNHGFDAAYRIFFASGPVVLRSELEYSNHQGRFENQSALEDGNGAQQTIFTDHTGADEVSSERLNLLLVTSVNLSTNSQVRARIQLQHAVFNRTLSSSSTGNNTGLSTRLALNHDFTTEAEVTISYKNDQTLPTVEDFFITPYLSGSYGIIEQDIRGKNQRGQHIRLHYRQQNTLKLRSWYGSVRYYFDREKWSLSSSFTQSLLISRPLFVKPGNRFFIAGGFDQFLAPVRTNIKLSLSYSRGNDQFNIEQNPVNLRSEDWVSRITLRTKLIENINVILDNRIGFYSLENNNSNTNTTMQWKAEYSIIYQFSKWKLFAEFYRTSNNNSFARANLSGLKAGCKYSFYISQKKASIELLLINLLNTQTFDRVRTQDVYLFQSSVESVPLYGLIRFDYFL